MFIIVIFCFISMKMPTVRTSTPESPARSSRLTGLPSPAELLAEVEAEPDFRGLRAYTSVICGLRKKGFSFREIAEWLTERGVEANHSAVYRVFAKGAPEGLQAEIQQQEDEAEALRNA